MSAAANPIMDALPGLPVNVSEAAPRLAEMWAVEPVAGSEPPSSFRASQMSLILHFGRKTTPDQARAQFDTALRFARKRPCRIIALCPTDRDSGEKALEGKIHAQCWTGASQRDMICCEAIIAGYLPEESERLEDQVSVWLDFDLPVIHWIHRISRQRVEDRYLGFAGQCRRIIYDSCIEEDGFDQIQWPCPEKVRDLAMARLLPVRQALGQLLSAHAPEAIAGGLLRAQTQCSPARKAEGAQLARWVKERLRACANLAGADPDDIEFRLETPPSCSAGLLELHWSYTDGDKHFHWRSNSGERLAAAALDFGGGATARAFRSRSLAPEAALAEAVFS